MNLRKILDVSKIWNRFTCSKTIYIATTHYIIELSKSVS